MSVVLCDLDSIVADLLGSWLPAYNAAHGRSMTVADVTEWDMHKCSPDGHRVYDALHAPGLFRNLNPLAGAVAGLRALHDAGHHVIILTASAKMPQTAADKLEWIREHLPWLSRKDVLIGHRKYLVRGDVLIDDSPVNIREYRQAWPDAQIVTIDYPYNREAPASFRAMDYADTARAWREIVAYVEASRGPQANPPNQPRTKEQSDE